MSQGTVLGPILFLAHVVDIDFRVQGTVSCFADDTRVTQEISSPEDACILQRDLERIYPWAGDINMKFNEDKFKVLYYADNLQEVIQRNYLTPGRDNIEKVSEIKNLGIWMADTGKFSLHIERAVKRPGR